MAATHDLDQGGTITGMTEDRLMEKGMAHLAGTYMSMLTGSSRAPLPAKLRIDNLHYDLTEDQIYVGREKKFSSVLV